jgi:hypothetical protein
MLIDPGHYRALLWKEDNKAWTVDQALGIHVNVEVSPFDWHARLALSTGHQVVDTRGPPDGRFTFTSHEAGKSATSMS